MKAKSFLAVLIILSQTLFAQRNENFGLKKFYILDLTEQQKSELQKIKTEAEVKLIDLRADLQKERIKLRDILSQEKIDEKAYNEITKRIREIQNQIFDIHNQSRLKLMQLLTKEQRQNMNFGIFGTKYGYKGLRKNRAGDCPFY
jgi:Spy/CpxP family protein refolding chaperone